MRAYKGETLQSRLNQFSVSVIIVCKRISYDRDISPLINQLIRSSSSVALNHAEATGTWSIPDFIAKQKISLKEAQETKMNLEILSHLDLSVKDEIMSLKQEADDICAILYASIRTASRKK